MSACASAQRAPAVPASTHQGEVVHFRFPLPDGRSIGEAELAGRTTVILFMTTYDTISQVVAKRLEELRHTRTPRINVLAVALEPPQNAPLVAVYRETLGLGYDVALVDQDTFDGRGTFGDVRAVPTLILLGADSTIVRRGSGAEALAEIEAALGASDSTDSR